MPLLLTDWTAVRFTGADCLEWLQGQLTQDVLKRADAGFCWLEPSGRCLTFGWLHFESDAVGVLVPEATVPAVLKRVDEMVVMEDVEAAAAAGSVVFKEPFGLALADSSDLSGASGGNREAVLLERGFPIWGVDINERSIPFDLGEAFVQATVSANKGCYVGQEIIARMRSHDQKPRDWVGLVLGAPVEPGDRIEDCGTITRSAFSKTLGPIASASISKRSLVEGQIVEVSTDNGKVKAEVRRMPLLRE